MSRPTINNKNTYINRNMIICSDTIINYRFFLLQKFKLLVGNDEFNYLTIILTMISNPSQGIEFGTIRSYTYVLYKGHIHVHL